MRNERAFEFGGTGVSESYDSVLVPLFFDAWAEALVKRVTPTAGMNVVDLATGTGVVAQKVARHVGEKGRVTAVDISPEMLSVARRRCEEHGYIVAFVESPAAPLAVESNTADIVYCQQGIQFFPDRRAAAAEMLRALKPGGRAAVSAWCPVDQCTWFGAIHDTLQSCGEGDIADMIAVPFNHMPSDELVDHFTAAGFADVELEMPEDDMIFEGGIEQAYRSVYATPIGPKLQALPENRRAAFKDAMFTRLQSMTESGTTEGRLVSSLLVARRPE